jgi:hypothetical protein
VLLIVCANVDVERTSPASTKVHLSKPKLFVQLGDKQGEEYTPWILDSNPTNHMTGEHEAFFELDTKVHGTVHFEDGSMTNIEGRGTILLQCKNDDHKVLGGVYFIPWPTANIVSLRQLEEDRRRIPLFNGYLKVWDRRRVLVAKVAHVANRIYTLKLNIGWPVCLAAQGSSVAWKWPTWFDHLNFWGIRRLADGEMVDGLP